MEAEEAVVVEGVRVAAVKERALAAEATVETPSPLS